MGYKPRMQSEPEKSDTNQKQGQAWKLGREVLDHLEARLIPPVPENYAVWFRHIAGLDEQLSEEIRHHEERGATFDPLYSQHLFKHYGTLSGQPEQAKTLTNTQDILSDALSVITSIITEADSKNSAIQGRLDGIIEDKGEKDINTVVEALVTVATEMKKNSTSMRASLEESRKEVEGLKKNLEDVSTEAQRDFLTGVYNRKALDAHMKQLMEEASAADAPLSLLVLDVDHFKAFNDNFGHLIGDEVLKMVAKILTDSVKGKDVVARFGGEEFVVLLPATQIGGAMVVAENIRKSIAGKELRHKDSGSSYGSVTVSIGVAAFNMETDTATTWLERADEALYRSKRGGRNQVTQENLACKD